MKTAKVVLPKNISITIQTALLSHLDKYCSRHNLSHSQVICRSTKNYLAPKLYEDPSFWVTLYDKEEE